MKRVLGLFVVLALVVTMFAACGSESKTIKIGAIQPISGQVSAYGTQSRDAINMAVEEINANALAGPERDCEGEVGPIGSGDLPFLEDDDGQEFRQHATCDSSREGGEPKAHCAL